MSPILHQIRTSTSKIEAEQWVDANGGAGWIALQVGATAAAGQTVLLIGCARGQAC